MKCDQDYLGLSVLKKNKIVNELKMNELMMNLFDKIPIRTNLEYKLQIEDLKSESYKDIYKPKKNHPSNHSTLGKPLSCHSS